MSNKDITIDRHWILGYIDRLNQEKEQLDMILSHLTAAKREAEISQWSTYSSAISDLQELRREIFTISEILLQFDADTKHDAQILEQKVQDLHLPDSLQ